MHMIKRYQTNIMICITIEKTMVSFLARPEEKVQRPGSRLEHLRFEGVQRILGVAGIQPRRKPENVPWGSVSHTGDV